MSNQNPQRSNEPPVWLMFSAGGMVLTIFPMWAGLHRIHHGMHDIKVHVPAGGVIFYGLATLYTIVVIWGVTAI